MGPAIPLATARPSGWQTCRSPGGECDQDCAAACRRTCLDQGSVVIFADEYSPANPHHISVPALDMTNIMVRPPLIFAPVIYLSHMAGCCNAVLTKRTQAMPSLTV